MTESDLIKAAARPYPVKRIFVEGIEEFDTLQWRSGPTSSMSGNHQKTSGTSREGLSFR
ncbi:MAG: hypothetical protein JNN16_08380 [Nitrospira sp.]|nr:hypothetical protein [Nitrospira sp.]